MFRAESRWGIIWARSLAALSLGGVALAVLAPSPSAAARGGGSGFGGGRMGGSPSMGARGGGVGFAPRSPASVGGRRVGTFPSAGAPIGGARLAPYPSGSFGGGRIGGSYPRSSLSGGYVTFGYRSNNWRIRAGYGYSSGRHYGYRPHYGYGYRPYYSGRYYGGRYYGGLYAYPIPYLGYYDPFYSYSYAPYPAYSYSAPSSVYYIYTPPVVRDYSSAPPAPAPPRSEQAPQRAPHPYEDPVPLSPQRGTVDEALASIRSVWLKGDAGLLRPYLPGRDEIALYRDGELGRSIGGDEFLQLTREAIDETRTLRFHFTEVRRPAADEVTATAVQSYVPRGADQRDAQSVTLQYGLLLQGGVWTLRSVRVTAGK